MCIYIHFYIYAYMPKCIYANLTYRRLHLAIPTRRAEAVTIIGPGAGIHSNQEANPTGIQPGYLVGV